MKLSSSVEFLRWQKSLLGMSDFVVGVAVANKVKEP